MKILHWALGLIMAVSAGMAFARGPVALMNFENVAYTISSGKKPSDAQMQQAISRAGSLHQWSTTPNGENKAVATVNVRGKHGVVVDISWNAETFSIIYKSSVNMDYADQARGISMQSGPVIHPSYNKWVASLRDSIQSELSRL
jgi:hypothetical protein